jgi:RNA polymerase sigma factor (sigma-70 family)
MASVATILCRMATDHATSDANSGRLHADWLNQHARWLRTVLLTRSGDRSAVDELFQDLALVVCQSAGTTRTSSSEVAAAQSSRRRPSRLVGQNGPSAAVDPPPQNCEPSVVRNPLAWLYGIAARLAVQHRRRLGRERRHTTQWANSFAAQESDSEALTWLLHQERQALVQLGLQRLLPKERELLLLKYTEDWSYRDLAQHLATTEAAVESRLHRARQKLRQILLASMTIEVNP